MDITRNKLRAAAVWMDEYSKLVEYASPPLPKGITLGDLEDRRHLREKLQCKSFSWYLKNVATGLYAPEIEGLFAGSLANVELDACIDTLQTSNPGLYPCHGQHGTQGLVMDGDGLVRLPILMYERCLSVNRNDDLTLSRCPRHGGKGSSDMLWTFNKKTRQFYVHHDLCLQGERKSTHKSPYSVKLAHCDKDNIMQK